MKCLQCDSELINKNGHRLGKQNFIFKNCGRQLIEDYSPRGDLKEVKCW